MYTLDIFTNSSIVLYTNVADIYALQFLFLLHALHMNN